jgi:hypothetical protein
MSFWSLMMNEKNSNKRGLEFTLAKRRWSSPASQQACLLGATLRDARENAKLAACQSNLGQVTKGFLMYAADLGKCRCSRRRTPVCSWNFGGWSGRNREYWEAYSLWNIQSADGPQCVHDPLNRAG